MTIFLYVLLLIAGFVALIKGADWFVDGSSGIAKILKVPGVIVGLTIVAMGTSAPELAVSTSAALSGSNEIALSNVIGSNTFNLLCVLGACALVSKVPVEPIILKRDFPLSFIVTIFLLVTCGFGVITKGMLGSVKMDDTVGMVYRATGITLLVFFVIYIVYLIRNALKNPEPETEEKILPVWKCIILIIVGVCLIVGGGEAVVRSAKVIAKAAGMSETLIGLTIVAVGTSLPELVTSFVAARKGETGMAIGNVVGSNIFNFMMILGISTTIHPISVNFASICDLIVLTVINIVLFLFVVKDKELRRPEGIIMLLMYVGEVVFAALR